MGFGPSRTEREALEAQAGASRAAGRKARAETARESRLFAAAEPQIGMLSNFFRGLLSGDRGILARAFAPQLEDIRRTAGSTRERILQDVPAGGATSAALAQTEQGVGAARGSVLQSAPTVGAGALSNLFQTLLGGAAQQGQLATGSLGAQTAGLGNILTSEAERRKSKFGFLGGIGEAVGGPVGGFIGKKLFG